MEGIPPSGRDTKCCQIPKVDSLICAAAKYVHDIVHKGCCMPFSRRRDKPNAIELSPLVSARIIGPNVVEPL